MIKKLGTTPEGAGSWFGGAGKGGCGGLFQCKMGYMTAPDSLGSAVSDRQASCALVEWLDQLKVRTAHLGRSTGAHSHKSYFYVRLSS
jgi:hypothetical protein